MPWIEPLYMLNQTNILFLVLCLFVLPPPPYGTLRRWCCASGNNKSECDLFRANGLASSDWPWRLDSALFLTCIYTCTCVHVCSPDA